MNKNQLVFGIILVAAVAIAAASLPSILTLLGIIQSVIFSVLGIVAIMYLLKRM
jgi:hypothetical protein